MSEAHGRPKREEAAALEGSHTTNDDDTMDRQIIHKQGARLLGDDTGGARQVT